MLPLDDATPRIPLVSPPRVPVIPAVPQPPPPPTASKPKPSKGLTQAEVDDMDTATSLRHAEEARSHAIDMAQLAADAKDAAVAAARAAAIVHATAESRRLAAQLRLDAEAAAAKEIERALQQVEHARRKAAEMIAVADAVGAQVRRPEFVTGMLLLSSAL
jgi:isopropylmalate/homocitrate/citramalate synthase